MSCFPLCWLLLLLLLELALIGCTKLEVTPPDYSLRLSENKQLKKPFDRVWARALVGLMPMVAIERIDESTGYIEGKLHGDGQPFMDCGTVAM